MSHHFVAELSIKKVERTEKSGARGETERVMSEVAKLVLKADTLENLTGKLTAHVSLIEE